MRAWALAGGLLAAGVFWQSGRPAAEWRVIDLGHPLAASDPSWTGEPVFSRTAVGTVEKDGYTGGRFSSDEHFGTHVDAPSHFGGSWTVDRIPADRLVRPGVAIDVRSGAAANDDYQLTRADVERFEARHGRIEPGTVVLVMTGWDARWPDRARYMNERGGVKHFPGLSVEAAAYLAVEREVAAIGIDTPSVDHGPSQSFEVHRLTMTKNVYHIENAARLTALPATGFTVVLAPVALAGGSGGPARVLALVR
jgi:kynurenine formamidase